MLKKMAILIGSLAVTSAPSASLAAASSLEDSCVNVDTTATACLRWCRAVENEGGIDKLPNAQGGMCRQLLRAADAKTLKRTACGSGVCIHRLRKDKGGRWTGPGFTLQYRMTGTYQKSDRLQVVTIKEASGRVIRFESFCGGGPQCDPWLLKAG